MPPKDFPPWRAARWRFRRLIGLALFATIHGPAAPLDRQRAGGTAAPSAGVLDSQTVKAPAAGAGRGWDGARRTVGRRRHIAVDADGRLPMVNLTPADISDSPGAKAALRALRTQRPWMKTLFADSAYDRAGPMDEAAMLGFTVEVVRKIEGQTGFQVLPRRRVVERTFRLDDQMAPPRARPRGPRRRLRSHDAHRRREPPHPKAQPSSTSRNGP